MSDQKIRDMSWRNLLEKCTTNPLWSANTIVNQDKRIEDLEAAALPVKTTMQDVMDILDGKL